MGIRPSDHHTGSVFHLTHTAWNALMILRSVDGTTETSCKSSYAISEEARIPPQNVRHITAVLCAAGAMKQCTSPSLSGGYRVIGVTAAMDYSLISLLDVIELFGHLDDRCDFTDTFNNESTVFLKKVQNDATSSVRKALSRMSIRELFDAMSKGDTPKIATEEKYKPVMAPLIRMNIGYIGIRGVM